MPQLLLELFSEEIPARMQAAAARDLERLPQPLRDLAPRATYPVEVAAALERLAAAVDERIASSEGTA